VTATIGEPGHSRTSKPEENTIGALRTRTLTVTGHSFRVTSRSANGSPATSTAFVLIHGIGMSHRYLDRLADRLGGAGDTHSFDLPGFGGTAKPSRVLSVEDHAQLLAEALDRIGVSRAVLIGHSMGAQFVTELARIRPDLAVAVVLIAPVTDPARATAFEQARDLIRDCLGEPWTGNTLTAGAYLRCGPRWFFSTLPTMLHYRTDIALAQVQAPALVLRGENDPVSRRAWCQKLAQVAPLGEFVEVPGKRHLVQFSAADETAAAILDLLRRATLAQSELL
jgi:pimeloyl-ACP methyl ester carboxylesterase